MRFILIFVFAAVLPLSAQWTTVGANAQHTGLSAVGAQPLNNIKWSTKVDQTIPDDNTDEIFAHFGAPIITAANTVFVPVHTSGGYEVEIHNGATGALKGTLTSDWVPPVSGWTPSYGPGLSARNRFYYPGAGGTVYYVDSPDTNSGTPTGQIAFYGTALYQATPAAFNSTVTISTPIVSDRGGNIFFGFLVTGSNPANLVSGIARISYNGTGSWVSGASAANLAPDASDHVPINSVPALSNDHLTLYAGVNATAGPLLISLNASTLAPLHQVALIDPKSNSNAQLPEIGSASPVVGPDGDVYYGVFESACCLNHDRGWLLHFSSTLSATNKIVGAFGWDDTPSIVPAALVPNYHGPSTYLIFSKYNNYAGAGGDGLNKIAVLDPFASATDPITGVAVMAEVQTILGPTPDSEFAPPAVREWCINSGAIDKVHKSVVANSEDGKLYWWDLTSNSFTQQITLTAGVGEAYTPTVIGPDGTVYAINNARLFAVGN
jgi:hypothetical protein